MDLDLRGHPLHTRALSVTLRQGGPGRRDAAASLLDVRKRTIKAAASLTSLVAGFLENNGSKEECQKTDPDPQRSPYSPPE